MAPKTSADPPMAMKDKSGNLITDKAGLEHLYIDTYKDRLTPNLITPGLETLEDMKDFLFNLRLYICKDRKTKQWSSVDVENVLKTLKNNKARDSHGHIYELFKFGGEDLKQSMLKMFNLVKDKQIYPSILQIKVYYG